MILCSICDKPISGLGHNAEPINSDRCCDSCNVLIVIPARMGVSLSTISEMGGVREWCFGRPVELRRDEQTDRLVIHATAGPEHVDIDLWDVLDWLANGPCRNILTNGRRKFDD